MFERYTYPAKLVVFWARFEADHRDEPAIAPRYILAGLITDGCLPADESAPLRSLGVELRALLGIPHRPSTAFPYGREREIPLGGEAIRALAYAQIEADSDRSFWIDTHHLLRGLLCFSNEASEALKQVGLDLEAVRRAPQHFRSQPDGTTIPLNLRFRYFAAQLREARRRLTRNYHFLRVPILLLLLTLILILIVKLRGPL